ncbi:MAG: glutathione peroxidase [Massilia sp.]
MNTFDFEASSLAGQPVALSRYRGKVLLIVNTASACGFTPQYEGLEQLYRRHAAEGLEVLGFPCNQFRQQESGTASDIAAFCEREYGVSFPMFAKIDVNGAHAHPLFTHLKRQARGVLGTKAVKWNFTKFLVDRDGNVVRRYAPATKPAALDADIAALLVK